MEDIMRETWVKYLRPQVITFVAILVVFLVHHWFSGLPVRFSVDFTELVIMAGYVAILSIGMMKRQWSIESWVVAIGLGQILMISLEAITQVESFSWESYVFSGICLGIMYLCFLVAAIIEAKYIHQLPWKRVMAVQLAMSACLLLPIVATF